MNQCLKKLEFKNVILDQFSRSSHRARLRTLPTANCHTNGRDQASFFYHETFLNFVYLVWTSGANPTKEMLLTKRLNKSNIPKQSFSSI